MGKRGLVEHSVNEPRVHAMTVVDEMVEAGGVEPPSEKRYDTKPTCLSQFGVRPGPCGMVARSPAALRMSKKRSQLVRWFSPEPYGPKGPGQLTV